MLLRHVIPSNNDVEEIYIVKQEEHPAEFHCSSLLVGTNFCSDQEDHKLNDNSDEDINGDDEYDNNDTVPVLVENMMLDMTAARQTCDAEMLPCKENVKAEPVENFAEVSQLKTTSGIGDIHETDMMKEVKVRSLRRQGTRICHEQIQDPSKDEGRLRIKREMEPKTPSSIKKMQREELTQCFICRRDFLQRKKLLDHLRIEHEGELPFDCKKCVSETIRNLNRLNLHHQQHDPQLKRCCLYCPARFSCGQAVSRHMRKLHRAQYDIDAEKTRRFVCRYCQQKFTKKYDLLKHEKKHFQPPNEANDGTNYTERELRCYICNDFTGESREKLNKHVRLQHSDWLPYQCDKCDNKLINSARVLCEHLRQHVEGLAIKCVYCEKRFVSLADCQHHEEKHHVQEKQMDEEMEAKIQAEIYNTKIVVIEGQKRFQCDYCERSYTLLSTLRRHLHIHSLANSFACQFCGKFFSNSASLGLHEKRNHDASSPFSCDVCSKCFKDTRRLIEHRRTHSGEKPFICEICGKCFRVRQILREHKLSCFGPETTQRCFCRLCSQMFENLPKALEHVKASHNQEIPETKCCSCDLLFRDAESLVEHEFRHTLPGIITCQVCNRIFKHHKNLMRHIKMHADQPVPYMCDLCGKTFTQKGSLTIHRRIHTGERPFSCELCHKGFVDKKERRRHYTSHFNPQSKLYIPDAHQIATPPEAGPNGKKYKTYNCKICGRQFTSSSNLAKHVTTHTGEKKYMCEFCEKRFSQGGQLTVHRRIHTGERPFSCENCGDRFLDGSSFKRHKTQHLCKAHDKPPSFVQGAMPGTIQPTVSTSTDGDKIQCQVPLPASSIEQLPVSLSSGIAPMSLTSDSVLVGPTYLL